MSMRHAFGEDRENFRRSTRRLGSVPVTAVLAALAGSPDSVDISRGEGKVNSVHR